MDKSAIVKSVIERIELDLAGASRAAHESAAMATDEESRSEGKYDTRGLETSYLASAQAHYAKELIEQLDAYRNLVLAERGPEAPAAIGSLITTSSTDGEERFFLGPAQGGLELETDEGTILILTPKSPLGREFLGKKAGANVAGQRTIIRIQ